MKHLGGCHCGRVKFEVEMNLENAISCNCSICLKRGSLLDFVSEEKFKLISGSEHIQKYLFNKKTIQHLFCKECGILSFGKGVAPDGSSVVAINVRCIDGVDLDKIKIQAYNGKDI